MKLENLNQENLSLFEDLNIKEEEIHSLNNQINNLIEELDIIKFENERIISLKDKKITELNKEIDNLDIYIQKYQNDLIEIKGNFDLSINEYQQKLNFKDIEISKIQDKYEKEKYEVILIYYYFIIFDSLD